MTRLTSFLTFSFAPFLDKNNSVTGRYDKNWVDYKTRNNEFANTAMTIDAGKEKQPNSCH